MGFQKPQTDLRTCGWIYNGIYSYYYHISHLSSGHNGTWHLGGTKTVFELARAIFAQLQGVQASRLLLKLDATYFLVPRVTLSPMHEFGRQANNYFLLILSIRRGYFDVLRECTQSGRNMGGNEFFFLDALWRTDKRFGSHGMVRCDEAGREDNCDGWMDGRTDEFDGMTICGRTLSEEFKRRTPRGITKGDVLGLAGGNSGDGAQLNELSNRGQPGNSFHSPQLGAIDGACRVACGAYSEHVSIIWCVLNIPTGPGNRMGLSVSCSSGA
jgi:hypothetical protein